MMIIVWAEEEKNISVKLIYYLKCIDIFVNIVFVLFLLLNCFLFIIHDANKLIFHF